MFLTTDQKNETMLGDFEMFHVVNQTKHFSNNVVLKNQVSRFGKGLAMIYLKRLTCFATAHPLLNVVLCMCGISQISEVSPLQV